MYINITILPTRGFTYLKLIPKIDEKRKGNIVYKKNYKQTKINKCSDFN